MPSPLDELNTKYRDWLTSRKTNWPQGPQVYPPPGEGYVEPEPPGSSIPDRISSSMLGAAAGLILGGPPGALAGAIIPQLQGIHPALDEALQAMPPEIPGMAVVPRTVKLSRARGGFLEGKLSNKPEVVAGLRRALRENSSYGPEANDVHRLINARDSVFHATDLEGFKGILKQGEIVSTLWQPISGKKTHPGPNLGVSVSRVPRISPKASKAITFVIDRRKMPKSRPLAERGYRKTNNEKSTFYGSHNPVFEFENRTYNKPIPLSAVKGILIDKSAFQSEYRSGSINSVHDILDIYDEIKSLTTQYNIPIRFLPSGRSQHSYRAGLRKLPTDQLWGAAAGASLSELARRKLDEFMAQQRQQQQPTPY